jgi:hypothetical protein
MEDQKMETIKGFENAVVIVFSAGYYRAKKKISREKLEQMVSQNPSAAEWLTGSRSIIDPVEIKAMGKLYNKATGYLNPDNPDSPCLPHPIAGFKLIPIDLMMDVDAELTSLQTDFYAGRDKFIGNFESMKAAGQSTLELDGLWSEMDYPADITSKFHFGWKFLQMDTPEKLKSLSPELYEREKKKLEADMEYTRLQCVEALRATMADMIGHIIERFSNGGQTAKVYRDSTVENFYDFFETFKSRNIFKDDALAEVVNKAQAVLKGRPAGIFRENDSVKKQVRGQMKSISDEMETLFEKPRRKINLD